MGLPRIGITSEPLDDGRRRTDGTSRDLIEGVAAAGGLPVVLPVLDPEFSDATLEGLDGLLVAGGDVTAGGPHRSAGPTGPGGVRPTRADFELGLVRAALAAGLPILGICRGHQVLNVALGGTLVLHLPPDDEGELSDLSDLDPVDDNGDGEAPLGHEVRVAAGSLLASVVGDTELGVNSQHHQVVELAGNGLQVVARSLDGHIEAVEGLGDLRVLGVQWRPELLRDHPAHGALFEWLVREAAATPAEPGGEAVPAAEVGPMPTGRTGRAVA